MLVVLLLVMLLSGCAAGPGERISVPIAGTTSKGTNVEFMATAYQNGNDNFGPSKVTVKKGDYEVVVDRSMPTGYEGLFATTTTVKDGVTTTTQQPLMASQRASYAWDAFFSGLGTTLGKVGQYILGTTVVGAAAVPAVGAIP